MKRTLTIILGAVVIALVAYAVIISDKNSVMPPVSTPVTETPTPLRLCFYNSTKTKNGLADVSWVSMNLAGEKVTGEFQYIPAEKDKMVGTFEGSVGAVDKVAMARTIDAWWSAQAEGMTTKQQLKIVFGEGTAQAAFGEMVDRGDGVYVYKDTSKLTWGVAMSDVDCATLPGKTTAVVTPTPLYLKELTTKYISHVGAWPPKPTLSTDAYVCKAGSTPANGTTAEKTINGRVYCTTVQSEGAAGSTYTTYTYKMATSSKLATLSFILRFPQCMNYDQPKQNGCKAEVTAFNADQVADGLMQAGLK